MAVMAVAPHSGSAPVTRRIPPAHASDLISGRTERAAPASPSKHTNVPYSVCDGARESRTQTQLFICGLMALGELAPGL
jgi:hypothetical protein